jgi:hypothetical protein
MNPAGHFAFGIADSTLLYADAFSEIRVWRHDVIVGETPEVASKIHPMSIF